MRSPHLHRRTNVTAIPTRRLIAWLTHPDSHPLLLSAARRELTRRGFEVRS